MKHLSSFGLVVLLALPQAALAEQVRVSCTNIADATERLACFDRTFPGDTKAEAGSRAPTQSVQTTTVEPQAPVVPPPPQSRVETPADHSNRELFSSKEKISISSKLKSVRDIDKQKMVFLLENDQIWLQDSPRSLPFTKGQDITIKSGTIGGYLLSNEEGVSTRVRRLK